MTQYEQLFLRIRQYKSLKRYPTDCFIGFYDDHQKYYVKIEVDHSLLFFDNYNSLYIYRENVKTPSLDVMCCIGAYMIYVVPLAPAMFQAMNRHHRLTDQYASAKEAAIVLEEVCAPRLVSQMEAGLLDDADAKKLLDPHSFDHDDRQYVYAHVLNVMRSLSYLPAKIYFSVRFHVDDAIVNVNALLKELTHYRICQ